MCGRRGGAIATWEKIFGSDRRIAGANHGFFSRWRAGRVSLDPPEGVKGKTYGISIASLDA